MGNYIGYRDGGKTNEEGLMKYLNQAFSGGFPISSVSTSLQATQRGTGANMSVDVAAGNVHLPNPAGSYSYWGWTDAVNNVVISAADPTNPRIDVLVAYLDLSVVASASNNNPGALKFYVQTGTPAGSPTTPSDATIQAALGSTTPFQKIATIQVAALAATVTNAVISDVRASMALKISAGSTATSGWNSLLYAPNTITPNGNRSYSMVFNGNDLTGTLSAGMRIRTTRTVNAPTQCTNLNGTTQFYSKTSPAGMTFTNNFVVSGWIKLSSYAAGTIASRYNGTNGWILSLLSTGQVQLAGFNGSSSNFSAILSSQSTPLNKWIHISAQLDMATFTATTTTSYVMFDGIDVPASVSRAGTNPTALVQAGNLEVGSLNGGAQPFPGKLAQVAIYSAKVTQATILASIHQPLAGTETNLISAYSFNNSINDLNTTNANNLTANGSAVATNADSPFGGQADGTISTTLDYGIIQKVSFSTNTTIIVQVPEGCTIPTTGGITAVAYSGNKVPYGFPTQRAKWCIEMINKSDVSQNASVANTWYNLGSQQLNIPIGEWRFTNYGTTYRDQVGDNNVTMSTSSSTETDSNATQSMNVPSNGATPFHKEIFYSLSAATIYYLLVRSTAGTPAIYVFGARGATILRAENAFL